MHSGEYHSWGDPFGARKKVPFYTESSKKSISLGNGEPDHFAFSDKKPCEPHKNCPGQSRFHILSLSSLFFFWWRASGKYSMYMSLQPNSFKISWPGTAKYCSLSGARILGKYLAIHKLYCFLLLYFHFWSCPGGSRNTFSIFYVLILWASPRTKCWQFTWKMYWGEYRSSGGPLCGEQKGSFLYRK